jgi:DNA-binding NtrC family response regulator
MREPACASPFAPLVVCVDDEPRVLAALRRSFRGEPFRVATTREPLRVLQWLERRNVAVVIADQRMSRGGGIDLLDEVRRRRPSARRVLLTGFPDGTALLDPGGRAMERLLGKPWDVDGLRRTVRELLRGREVDVGTREFVVRLDCRGRTPEDVLGELEPALEGPAFLRRGLVIYLRDLPDLAHSHARFLEELARRMGRSGGRALLLEPAGLAEGFVDAPPRAGPGRRVLVVEASAERAEFLGALLDAAGHRTVVVPDGGGAERRLREEPFDRVILDLSRKGNPLRAIERTLGRLPRRPTLLGLSVWSGLWGAAPAFRRGEALCLPKPYGVRQLLDAVADPAKAGRRV